MAYNVIFTQPASEDLDEILVYLSGTLDSPAAARNLLKDLDAILLNLASMPEMYDRCQDAYLRSKDYRKALLGKYLLVFSIKGDQVYILRFFHGSQAYEKLL